MLEFLVLCLPTVVYLLVRRRAPDAVSVMGLRAGSPDDYAWAAVIAAGLATVAWAVLIWGIDVDVHGAGMTGPITGVVSGVAVLLRAAGEEVFFRGFVTGLLARRLGSIVGNLVQSVVFLLPHLLLLLVDSRLWPILPVQAIAGWLMGWLRLRHGSVLPAVEVHAVLNLAAALG